MTQQNLTSYTTHSPEETIILGHELARQLAPPKLVLLRGELGAGKTTLVKGIAEAFQAAEQDEVTSPTFTLIHEYRGPKITVYHIDLYRIDTERELATLGIDELLRDPSALVLIEWGEKFPRFVNERDVEITFKRLGEMERRITMATAKNSPVETNTHDLLIQAIKEKRLIRFLYNGKRRIAEPHDYGIQKGSTKLLSYQIGGESTTGGLPDWRSVDVPKISKLELLEEHFAGNREVPSGQHRGWETVFARVSPPRI